MYIKFKIGDRIVLLDATDYDDLEDGAKAIVTRKHSAAGWFKIDILDGEKGRYGMKIDDNRWKHDTITNWRKKIEDG